MRALSVKASYAYLIGLGIKDIENRAWTTSHRGQILIHSSGKSEFNLDLNLFPDSWKQEFYYSENKNMRYLKELELFNNKLKAYYQLDNQNLWKKSGKKPYLKSQSIIGSVDIVDIITNSNSCWSEKNCYHWVLRNAILFDKPIENIKGKLTLWYYTQNLN